MIVVENVIVSEDVAFVEFNCDLKSCHGDCCVEGDEGAPLEDYEIGIIEDYLDDIKPFMVEEGIKIVEKNGTFDYGMDGEYVTPLVNDRECAFVYFENGISFCAIEKGPQRPALRAIFCSPPCGGKAEATCNSIISPSQTMSIPKLWISKMSKIARFLIIFLVIKRKNFDTTV